MVDPELARSMSDGARVIALDPGECGMIAVRQSSGRVVFCSPLFWGEVVRHLGEYGKLVLLAEDQFLKMNPATTKELTWQTASLAGYLAGVALHQEHIVHVMPRVWQAEQLRRMKVPVRKQLNRKEGIQLAVAELREKVPAVHLASFNQKLIEGCASALGILLWWEALCAR